VQLPEKWSNVVVLRRGKHQPSSWVHHRLKPLEKIRRNASHSVKATHCSPTVVRGASDMPYTAVLWHPGLGHNVAWFL